MPTYDKLIEPILRKAQPSLTAIKLALMSPDHELDADTVLNTLTALAHLVDSAAFNLDALLEGAAATNRKAA